MSLLLYVRMECISNYNEGFYSGLLTAGFLWLVIKVIGTCGYINYNGTRVFTSRNSSMIVSGNITAGGSSITQSNSRVIINGVDVTGQNYTSPPIARAFRITADGQTLTTQLNPDAPIILRVAPDTIIGKLEVGSSLTVEQGGLHVTGSVNVDGTLKAHGPIHAEKISVEGSLTCEGNMVVDGNVKADGSINVRGDATWLDVSVDGSLKIGGSRKRRESIIRK